MIKNLSLLLLLTGFIFSTNVSAQPDLDTTFNSTGKTILTAGTSGTARDMVIQPDNKTVIVGACNNIGLIYPFCLFRLNEGGTLDQSFDDGQGHPGYVFTTIPGNPMPAGIGGIALQNDGKLVAAGFGSGQIVLIRYNANGTLDSSFATNGVLQSNLVPNATVGKILIQPDGKYVIVGSSSASILTQYVARFLPDGTPDNSFGSGGVVKIGVAGNETIGLAIALQADGKIVTSGGVLTLSGDPNPSNSFLLARLNRDGTLDTTFDGDGLKTISSGVPTSGFYYGIFRSVAVQSDGRILALGHTDLIFRFNADGSLDTSFDGDGQRVVFGTSIPNNGPNSETFDLMVTPSGKITVVGNPSTTVDFPIVDYIVARYLPNGSPDHSFDGDGFLIVNISGWDGGLTVAPDSNGRTVIGGRTSPQSTRFNPWRDPLFSAARLIASPTQNVGFSGRVLNSDGKPVINGFVTLTKGSETIAVGRTNPFGYFNFKNIPTNQTYQLSTRVKSMNFNTQSVLVDDAVTNFLVVGEHQ